LEAHPLSQTSETADGRFSRGRGVPAQGRRGLLWHPKDFLHQLGFFNLHSYRPYSLSSLSSSLKPIFIYVGIYFHLKNTKQ
jgi:hypothetical protein